MEYDHIYKKERNTSGRQYHFDKEWWRNNAICLLKNKNTCGREDYLTRDNEERMEHDYRLRKHDRLKQC